MITKILNLCETCSETWLTHPNLHCLQKPQYCHWCWKRLIIVVYKKQIKFFIPLQLYLILPFNLQETDTVLYSFTALLDSAIWFTRNRYSSLFLYSFAWFCHLIYKKQIKFYIHIQLCLILPLDCRRNRLSSIFLYSFVWFCHLIYKKQIKLFDCRKKICFGGKHVRV